MKKLLLPDTSETPDNSGVSLIIAIIFVSAFMLVMAGMTEAILSGIRMRGNWSSSGRAFYLAESAERIANHWAAKHGVGQNGSSTSLSPAESDKYMGSLLRSAANAGITNCADMDSDLTNGTQPCIGFEVSGRAEATGRIRIGGSGTEYFSAPSKGTGNAGSCADSQNADEACNWNRLYIGEAIEIPLYYEMPNGSASAHVFFTTGHEFKLRVRAPCEDFASTSSNGNCDATNNPRITLYPPAGSPVASPMYRSVEDIGENPRDPVLIQWSISDMGGAGTSTLLARDNTVTAIENLVSAKRRVIRTGSGFGASYTDQNTEISAGRINLAKDGSGDPLADFTVVQYIPSGLDRDKNRGIDLNRNVREIGPYISTFENPVLRLTLVGQPQKDDPLLPQNINNSNLNIPFLEYQVLTKDIEISDSKSFIRAWAQVGDFRKEFRKELKREATLGGFVIEQF